MDDWKTIVFVEMIAIQKERSDFRFIEYYIKKQAG